MAEQTITLKLELPDELKAGARHSSSDQQHMDAAMDHMIQAGATHPRLGQAVDPAAEWNPEKALINFGTEVKALGDGKVGGYLIRFSDEKTPDLTGDFFTAKTDFGEHDSAPILYQHGLDSTLKARVIGKGKLRKDDVGVWVEAQLSMRDEYEKAIYELAEKGKLGWSSGTASHLVERQTAGKANWIKAWPLGLDASLTPTPAEPRNSAITLKAYVDSLAGAEQPDPNGSQEPSTQPVSTPLGVQPKTQELKKMPDTPEVNAQASAEVKEQFDKLMAAITGIGTQVKAVTDDVAKMKAEPPIKTAGVAGMLEDGKAPAQLKGKKESYADQQISALKAYLHDEIGKPDWQAHQNVVRQNEGEAIKAFQNLTHSWKDTNMAALAAYEQAIKASMVEGTASLGGALVPTLYSNQLVGTLKEDSIVRKSGAYQFPVAGTNQFQVPKITRSGSAPLAAELAAGSQMEPTFGTQNFVPYAYRALYIASREQVLDTRIPMDSILMENAAWQLTQSENNHLVIGTGSSQPQGIVAAASTLGLSPGSTIALAFPDGKTGGDLLMDIYHGLPYQYRDNAAWYMPDSTIKVIRKLRDSSGAAASLGNFLWQPGLQAGQPDRILGRPVYTANNIATSGSTANVIAFGDPRFFWIADFNNGGMDFQVLNELYAASAAVGWWFWRRFDSHLLVSEAVVGLKLLS